MTRHWYDLIYSLSLNYESLKKSCSLLQNGCNCIFLFPPMVIILVVDGWSSHGYANGFKSLYFAQILSDFHNFFTQKILKIHMTRSFYAQNDHLVILLFLSLRSFQLDQNWPSYFIFCLFFLLLNYIPECSKQMRSEQVIS